METKRCVFTTATAITITIVYLTVILIPKMGLPNTLQVPAIQVFRGIQLSQPANICYESPYVVCGNSSRDFLINRDYRSTFGEFDRARIDLDLAMSLPPGLTVHRSNQTGLTRQDTYRVALYNNANYYSKETYQVFSFSHCHFPNCEFVGNKIDQSVDMVVVNGVELNVDNKLPLRWPHQVYLAVGWESPVHYHGALLRKDNPWTSLFNLTATFRRDADFFTPNSHLKYQPIDEQGVNYTEVAKSKNRTAIWIVSNCGAPSKRNKYVEQLKKYIDVDIFGKCGSPCPKSPDLCNIDMAQYMFYLSFENSLCPDYITEKLFKLFTDRLSSVVPVVRGGAQYDHFFPPGTFINADHYKNAHSLAIYLNKLKNNPKEFADLIERKAYYRIHGQRNQNLHCDMCRYLNSRDLNTTRYYPDIRHWVGTCRHATDV